MHAPGWLTDRQSFRRNNNIMSHIIEFMLELIGNPKLAQHLLLFVVVRLALLVCWSVISQM